MSVEKVEVHWPSGRVEMVALREVDRYYVIEEGKGAIPSVYDIQKKSDKKTFTHVGRKPPAGV